MRIMTTQTVAQEVEIEAYPVAVGGDHIPVAITGIFTRRCPGLRPRLRHTEPITYGDMKLPLDRARQLRDQLNRLLGE
jgi:hypothetical protein